MPGTSIGCLWWGGAGAAATAVDFIQYDAEHPPKIIADAIGQTASGGEVGVIIWGTANGVAGIEVYDRGAGPDDIRLPLPESIQPW